MRAQQILRQLKHELGQKKTPNRSVALAVNCYGEQKEYGNRYSYSVVVGKKRRKYSC